MKASGNHHDLRESWLRAATVELRPYFASVGYPLPENIRFAIAFPSTGRKGKRVGECWHSSTSEDQHYEIFIRADIAEPVEVLGVLVKELVHTALPANAGHGKLFKAAALKVGLQGVHVPNVPKVAVRKFNDFKWLCWHPRDNLLKFLEFQLFPWRLGVRAL